MYYNKGKNQIHTKAMKISDGVACRFADTQTTRNISFLIKISIVRTSKYVELKLI